MLVMNIEEKEVREGVVTYYGDLTTTANYLCRFQRDEAEIPVLCSYLGVLETARREALADERYEDVQRLIETIRYNTGTLEQLRREYSMMRKDSQSTR